MNVKILTTLLGIAVLAIPAAAPAGQPAPLRTNRPAPAATLVPAATYFATLLADPHEAAALTIVLPRDGDTFDWIDQDPLAL